MGKKPGLPDELWAKILEDVDDNSVTAFACVCKQLRRVQQASGRRLKTNLGGDWEKYNPDLGLFSWSDHLLQRLLEKYRRLQKLQKGHPLGEKWCLWSLTLTGGRFQEVRCIMNAAAFWGHLNLLKQWEEQDSAHKFNVQTCAYAAYGGHLEVLKHAQKKRKHGLYCGEQTFDAAAGGGHLDIMHFMHDHLYDEKLWGANSCAAAARGGHLEALKYLHEKACPWDAKTCEWAALRGHLDVLKYAHEKGCPWDKETCRFAARGGHLEVLKYLHEKKGCPLHEMTCSEAAQGGHLEVLKYLHEKKGCPLHERTCFEAAQGGHLEVLKYFRSKGCPWDGWTCA